MTEWISTRDILPKGREVLTFDVAGRIRILKLVDFWVKGNLTWTDDDEEECLALEEVTDRKSVV